MATYTITISDEQGVVAVSMKGPEVSTPAGAVASALMKLGPAAAAKASDLFHLDQGCDCDKCRALREGAEGRNNTIH